MEQLTPEESPVMEEVEVLGVYDAEEFYLVCGHCGQEVKSSDAEEHAGMHSFPAELAVDITPVIKLPVDEGFASARALSVDSLDSGVACSASPITSPSPSLSTFSAGNSFKSEECKSEVVGLADASAEGDIFTLTENCFSFLTDDWPEPDYQLSIPEETKVDYELRIPEDTKPTLRHHPYTRHQLPSTSNNQNTTTQSVSPALETGQGNEGATTVNSYQGSQLKQKSQSLQNHAAHQQQQQNSNSQMLGHTAELKPQPCQLQYQQQRQSQQHETQRQAQPCEQQQRQVQQFQQQKSQTQVNHQQQDLDQLVAMSTSVYWPQQNTASRGQSNGSEVDQGVTWAGQHNNGHHQNYVQQGWQQQSYANSSGITPQQGSHVQQQINQNQRQFQQQQGYSNNCIQQNACSSQLQNNPQSQNNTQRNPCVQNLPPSYQQVQTQSPDYAHKVPTQSPNYSHKPTHSQNYAQQVSTHSQNYTQQVPTHSQNYSHVPTHSQNYSQVQNHYYQSNPHPSRNYPQAPNHLHNYRQFQNAPQRSPVQISPQNCQRSQYQNPVENVNQGAITSLEPPPYSAPQPKPALTPTEVEMSKLQQVFMAGNQFREQRSSSQPSSSSQPTGHSSQPCISLNSKNPQHASTLTIQTDQSTTNCIAHTSNSRCVGNQSAEFPIHCELCDKNFESEMLYYKHRAVDHKVVSMKIKKHCRVCGKACATNTTFHTHMRRQHNYSDEKIRKIIVCQCWKCGKVEDGLDELLVHIHKHG